MAERKNVNNGDWDAKGDILVATANDAFDQLAVGATNGMALVVDSAQAMGLKYALPPGTELAQAQVTSDVTSTATTSGTMDTIISLPATTYAAVPIMLEMQFNSLKCTGSVTYIQLNFFDGSTSLSLMFGQDQGIASNGTLPGFCARLRYVPTAGSHTFSFRAFRTGGTNIIFRAAALDTGNNYAPLQMRAVLV